MPHNLTERIPDHLVEQWRNNAIFWNRLILGGITAFWSPLCVSFIWFPFRQSSGSKQVVVVCTAGAIVALGWCLFVFLLGRITANAWSPSKLPIIKISGDQITVVWHGETIEAAVADCNLRRGRAWQMKFASRKAGGLPIGDRELILIDLPPLHHDWFGHLRGYTTVAVGFTDDSMENWNAALGMDG